MRINTAIILLYNVCNVCKVNLLLTLYSTGSFQENHHVRLMHYITTFVCEREMGL